MKTKNIIGWAIAVLLSLAFLMTGISKLTGQEEMVLNFEKWGFPLAFMYFVGASEIAGAIGLLITKFRGLASIGLVLLMMGAIGTHILNSEAFIPPLVLLLLTGTLIWLRKNELSGLIPKAQTAD